MTEHRPGRAARLLAPAAPTSLPRTPTRIALGGMLAIAGISHLTVAREEFTAQVPNFVPFSEETTVVASGIVEITLGSALMLLARRRIPIGWAAALFFIAIFPGNIAQYVEGKDAFGLDTDRKRLVRLWFQPGLVALALWSTGAWRDRPRQRRDRS